MHTQTRAFVVLTFMLLALAGPACRQPGPGPEVNLAVSPRYPCEGDAVALTFSSTSVDKIDVTDASGRRIAGATGSSGAIAIARLDRSMLPLTATAWQGNQSRVQHAPGDVPLVVIAGTTATGSFALDRDVLGAEQRTRIGAQDCGCTLDDDGAPLLCEPAAAIYEVLATDEGQDRTLDRAWFSPRAHVVGVVNATRLGLTYFREGNRIAVVPPGEGREVDFASEIAPAGTWTAQYEAQNRDVRYAGTYIDGGMVCGGWIHRARTRPIPEVSVGFQLRCSE